MVGRLQVILLSILPTGAALVYCLWMFGWKKTKGTRGRHCQKTPAVEVTLEKSHDNIDITLPSSSVQCLLPVNNEVASPSENDVSNDMSVSHDLKMSHGLVYTDVTSPCGDESVSANTVACEQSSESAADVSSTISDHGPAHKPDKGHHENISVNDEADNIASEDEILKCAVIDSQENNTVAFLEDENYGTSNSCISNGNADDGNEATSDSGFVVSSLPSERCENGRRDSMGSVRMFLSW